MTGASFDVMSVRRVRIAQECDTCIGHRHSFVKGRTVMSPISIRNRRTILISLMLIVLIECVSIVAANGNAEHEIDKIHGRPNIEPTNPARPEDGATVYRRDNVHRKSESHAPKIGAAHHYNNYHHDGNVGHPNYRSWGGFHYTNDKGCEKQIQYVHWPVLGYQPSDNYGNKGEAHPPAYEPSSEYSPDNRANANDHYDRANNDNYDRDGDNEYEQAQPTQPEASNYANNDANNEYASKPHYNPKHIGNYEDYIPKPAEGYGFKKLVVPVHDVYNQKAYRPPTFDLSDLVFPAEESPNYANPLPYSGGYDNVVTPPHNGYGDSNLQTENVEYVGNAVDNFGNLPYKEKYAKPNYPAPASPYNNDVEEDYSPKGRDEFGVLPYKESTGQSKSFGAPPYDNHPTAPGTTSTPTSTGDIVSLAPAHLTSATVAPTVISTGATTTRSSAPSIFTAFQAVDLVEAIARAEQERRKLPEPGPSVPCAGEKSETMPCSAFFRCDATGKLFSCWANGNGDETSELVFDKTSQECRKFSAIKECTREFLCEGKQSLELVGGSCTRLAHNCGNNELVDCKVPDTVVDPSQGTCVTRNAVETCGPIFQRLLNLQ